MSDSVFLVLAILAILTLFPLGMLFNVRLRRFVAEREKEHARQMREILRGEENDA